MTHLVLAMTHYSWFSRKSESVKYGKEQKLKESEKISESRKIKKTKFEIGRPDYEQFEQNFENSENSPIENETIEHFEKRNNINNDFWGENKKLTRGESRLIWVIIASYNMTH